MTIKKSKELQGILQILHFNSIILQINKYGLLTLIKCNLYC